MKQTRSWLIVIIVLLCNITVNAYDFRANGISYEIISDSTVCVTYYDKYTSSGGTEFNSVKYDGDVIIPQEVTYGNITYSVTSIGDYAFRDCSSLTSITIPKGVTSIGMFAFYGCSRLTSINIPASVTSIGRGAFSNCCNLIAIVVAEGNKVYDSRNGCNAIIKTADNTLIAGCSTTIIPSSVTSIGWYAFQNCSRLTSITIPEGVTRIGDYAFQNCSSLTSITLPEGVTSIGDDAFYGCSRLTSITLPSSVTSIGGDAFEYCRSLFKVINYSNLSLSAGSFDHGSVARNAIQVIEGSELITIGDFQFFTSNGDYYLVNYIGQETDVVLLDNYNGASYNIGDCAFAGCSRLTSITLPSSVTSIGDCAFYNCSRLTSITLPESVTSIGDCAFYTCSRLTSITLPSSVTSIGDYAFEGCSSLTSITLPESVTSIGEGAFQNCSSLTSITIPKGVTSIGSYAFSGCGSLTSISLPSSVTSIGWYAFQNCSSLTSITIPEGVTRIGYYAFSGCGGELTVNCNIPSASSKSDGAFYGGKFNKVTIGEGVTSIGSYAFYGCSSLYSVTIPNGLLSIGSNAFSTPKKVVWLTNTPPTGYANAKGSINYVANDQYTNLGNTKVYPYLSSMFEVDGVKYVPVSPSERTCHAIDCVYKGTVESINISETTSFKGVAMKVTEVMPYTFYGNDHIKEVSVSHLGNIGDYAFYDCDGIENVVVSNQGGIGNQAFYNCDSIKDVNVSNLGNIGSQAFYNCDAIESVKVSNQGDIGEQAFYDCNGIKTIDVRNRGIICDQAFSGCTSLKSVVLGDSIGSLGNKAFYQCSSLQEIVIPDSVKLVGEYCFGGCSVMKNAIIGDGITAINNYAFSGCSSLLEISIPQATTTIGDYVFSGCSKLADVVIEDRTTALNLGSNGSSALFADCPLDSVYIGGKITYSTTSSYGYSPFYRNTSLRTVVITDREEQVYENEFYGCTNLQNVTIGNGVKSIGNYAFSGCSSLEGFSFGSSMESIGNEAFSDCTNLTSITSHAAVPPTCGTQALDDINKWNCVLRVPSGYAAAYQAAEQWKEFFFVEDVVEIDAYTLTYVVDGEVYHTEALAHKAPITAIAEPTKEGHTFSGWGEVPAVMPAQDITIYGTFAINKYMVSFVVDGVVMVANELEYGSAITVPTMPEREGYTFSGWGEVAETVPAHDVTYEACYVANVYSVFYFVGTKLVHTADVAYGEVIPEYVYEPTEEGDVFVGWIGESYDTMPAHDVTYTANITNDVLQLIIDNSQLTIYDLSGRKIEVDDLRELEKGVYVVNGRKVVINNK